MHKIFRTRNFADRARPHLHLGNDGNARTGARRHPSAAFERNMTARAWKLSSIHIRDDRGCIGADMALIIAISPEPQISVLADSHLPEGLRSIGRSRSSDGTPRPSVDFAFFFGPKRFDRRGRGARRARPNMSRKLVPGEIRTKIFAPAISSIARAMGTTETRPRGMRRCRRWVARAAARCKSIAI